jgi:hypothetical protein
LLVEKNSPQKPAPISTYLYKQGTASA